MEEDRRGGCDLIEARQEAGGSGDIPGRRAGREVLLVRELGLLLLVEIGDVVSETETVKRIGCGGQERGTGAGAMGDRTVEA